MIEEVLLRLRERKAKAVVEARDAESKGKPRLKAIKDAEMRAYVTAIEDTLEVLNDG